MNKKEALQKIKELEAYIENLDNPTYSIGDRFIIDNEEYILCCVDVRYVNLINLEDGTRWSAPVEVNRIKAITSTEFKELTGGYKFEKI